MNVLSHPKAKQRMDQLRKLRDKFFDFCATTSIPGLRNVADDATSVTSRIAWFVTVIISFVLATINIYNSYVGRPDLSIDTL